VSFYRFPVGLYRASGFVNAITGEVVSLTPAMKMIYVHLLTRFHFFTQKLKGEMYESQKAIANACDVDVKTVQRAITTFTKAGVVSVKVTRVGSKSRSVYKQVNTLSLVTAKKVVDVDDQPDIMDQPEYDDEFLSSINFGE
jgi:DNA-binding transcriptional MocR family regulator